MSSPIFSPLPLFSQPNDSSISFTSLPTFPLPPLASPNSLWFAEVPNTSTIEYSPPPHALHPGAAAEEKAYWPRQSVHLRPEVKGERVNFARPLGSPSKLAVPIAFGSSSQKERRSNRIPAPRMFPHSELATPTLSYTSSPHSTHRFPHSLPSTPLSISEQRSPAPARPNRPSFNKTARPVGLNIFGVGVGVENEMSGFYSDSGSEEEESGEESEGEDMNHFLAAGPKPAPVVFAPLSPATNSRLRGAMKPRPASGFFKGFTSPSLLNLASSFKHDHSASSSPEIKRSPGSPIYLNRRAMNTTINVLERPTPPSAPVEAKPSPQQIAAGPVSIAELRELKATAAALVDTARQAIVVAPPAERRIRRKAVPSPLIPCDESRPIHKFMAPAPQTAREIQTISEEKKVLVYGNLRAAQSALELSPRSRSLPFKVPARIDSMGHAWDTYLQKGPSSPTPSGHSRSGSSAGSEGSKDSRTIQGLSDFSSAGSSGRSTNGTSDDEDSVETPSPAGSSRGSRTENYFPVVEGVRGKQYVLKVEEPVVGDEESVYVHVKAPEVVKQSQFAMLAARAATLEKLAPSTPVKEKKHKFFGSAEKVKEEKVKGGKFRAWASKQLKA